MLSHTLDRFGRGKESGILRLPDRGQAASDQTWETKKGTLTLGGQLVSITIGRKPETMALADIESVEAAHLTLLQWLGWSGCLMWTGVGLLLAPFMILVPALLVPFLLLVPTPWLILLKNTAGRSIIVTIGPRRKALDITAAILAARSRLQPTQTLVLERP